MFRAFLSLSLSHPAAPLRIDFKKSHVSDTSTSPGRVRTSEGKGAAVEPIRRFHTSWYVLRAEIRPGQSQRLRFIAGFLRHQLGMQRTHSPLQIHARVRIDDPLKVIFCMLRDLLQTLRRREMVVVRPGEREERKMLPIFARTSCGFRGVWVADA